MLDSTVVCRRALGCEWGGVSSGTHNHNSVRDQVMIREDPAGAVSK